MDPLTILALSAAGGGLMGLMNYEQKQKEADAQRPLEEAKAKWSGFTGETPKVVVNPNLLGEILSGGIGGAQFGAQAASLFGGGGQPSAWDKLNATAPAIPGMEATPVYGYSYKDLLSKGSTEGMPVTMNATPTYGLSYRDLLERSYR